MGDKTAIEWTNATWNPATGCTKVSPGCKNCYAERLALSLRDRGMAKYRNGFKFTIHEKDLELPLRWRKPRMIFVNSMSDLFHEEMPEDFLRGCFAVMERAEWHSYQILTKRPHRMLEFSRRYGRIPDHIWMGTSVESRPFVSRIDVLRKVPAKIRFISFEPLIDSMRPPLDLSGIEWAIVGGESGSNYRPLKTEWIREIRDECLSQGVAFFFKQVGGVRAKSGGRLLDGRTWDQYPTSRVTQTTTVKHR
jgi:protein gp37